jgi:hypothetical protein
VTYHSVMIVLIFMLTAQKYLMEANGAISCSWCYEADVHVILVTASEPLLLAFSKLHTRTNCSSTRIMELIKTQHLASGLLQIASFIFMKPICVATGPQNSRSEWPVLSYAKLYVTVLTKRTRGGDTNRRMLELNETGNFITMKLLRIPMFVA